MNAEKAKLLRDAKKVAKEAIKDHGRDYTYIQRKTYEFLLPYYKIEAVAMEMAMFITMRATD